VGSCQQGFGQSGPVDDKKSMAKSVDSRLAWSRSSSLGGTGLGASPMKKQGYLIASALLSMAVNAQAKRDIREDPFAYEEREAERAREREEERESAPTQSFGNSGEFALSAERLLGVAHTTGTIVRSGPDTKLNIDRINGFVSSGGMIGYSVPRIAFDFFVTTPLSLGGSVGYGQNTGYANERLRVIVLSPRIGYALMFGKVVGIWPRVGATYQLMYSKAADAWLVAGTGDLPLVLVAGDHAVFTLGPRLDWSFTGNYYPEGGGKLKLRAGEYGFSAGVSLFF
jgi:hypothetical protein